jgi:hypothetical protein
MLQEKYLPVHHFHTKHSIVIASDVTTVVTEAKKLDFSGSPLITLLFKLRGLPTRTATGIPGLEAMGFVVLEERPNEEIILGLIGQFWKPKGNIVRVDPREFETFHRAGFAKATWNFLLKPEGQGARLSTETRIYCTDEKARKKFRWYWFFIRPFSGIIRMEILKLIKKKVELTYALPD